MDSMPRTNHVDPILPERLRRTAEEMHRRLLENLEYRTLRAACDIHLALTGELIILSEDDRPASVEQSTKARIEAPERKDSSRKKDSGAQKRPRKLRSDSKPRRVYEAVERYLAEHGDTHRQDLLKFLVAEELLGSESNPLQTLARLLSEAEGRFVGHGNGIWGLPAAVAKSEPPVS
jgi:hypothetical protein